MRIELEKLENTGGKFAQVYEIDQLAFDEGELTMIAPAEVRVRIRRADKEVNLRGELHTRIAVPCSRCLKPVELPIDSQFAERFVPAVSWRDEEQHELRAEDLDLAVFDGQGIELDDLVREEILLAMPGHVLCREDCQGFCSVCGLDRNAGTCQCEGEPIDSRWDKLKDLRS